MEPWANRPVHSLLPMEIVVWIQVQGSSPRVCDYLDSRIGMLSHPYTPLKKNTSFEPMHLTYLCCDRMNL